MSISRKSNKKNGQSDFATTTDYQLHKSILFPSSVSRFIIDFTAMKLLALIKATEDETEKRNLVEVINNYRKGKVAIAWRSGKPVWIQVTNESGR